MLFHACSDIHVDCKEQAKLRGIYFDDPMTTLAIIAIEDTVLSSVKTFSGLHAETYFFLEKNLYKHTYTHTHTPLKEYTLSQQLNASFPSFTWNDFIV